MRKPAAEMPVASRVARCIGGALQSCLVVVWFVFASIATHAAQRRTPVADSESPTQLLTSAEGRSILDAAWQQDLPARGTQDCSHLVHQIYSNAGFEYPYASSNEIYAGSENFARVKYPHAGDLIAWPGHVGIVVDPARHSFFSLVRSGLGEQDYSAPYWRSRGVARFYRLRVSRLHELAAANKSETSNDGAKSSKPFVGPIPARRAVIYDRSSDRPPVTAPVKSSANRSQRIQSDSSQTAKSTVADDDEPGIAPEADSDRPPTANPRRTSQVYGPPVPHEDSPPENKPASIASPGSVIISTSSAIPTRAEVAQSISGWAETFGNSVRDDDPFKSALPVMIVEQFSVEKIEVKHSHGWARVAVDSKFSIEAGAIQAKRRHEKIRWELRLADSGWEATPPTGRIYLPHEVAVKNLAAQLAQISASEGAAQHQEAVLQQEAQLAALLNALLQKK
jgi:hypothetical protein